MSLPTLCLVTDRRRLVPDARTTDDEICALESFLDDAIDAGIDLIQIRERDLEARMLVAMTRRIVGRARGTVTRVVVNDRVDVAVAAGAGGVHIRGDGPPSEFIRPLMPLGATIGRSIHEPEETGDTPDYFVFGTVFPTASKPGARLAGVTGLAQAARLTTAPLLAIGGITPNHASECRAAGAAGVAAIGVFLRSALGPSAAIAAFRSAWTRGT